MTYAFSSRTLRFVLIMFFLVIPLPGQAGEPADDASAAVAGILFDYDGDDFASYVVKSDGYVEITFAQNMPDALYSEITAKLRDHPGIKGVLPGKGGPSCSRW